MTWIYPFFDIASTITECAFIYFFTEMLYQKHDRKSLILTSCLPYFIIVCLLTYVFDTGIWKSFIVNFALAAILWLCNRGSVYKAFTCTFLCFASMTFTEAVIILLYSVFSTEMTLITVAGQPYLVWYTYPLLMIFRLILLYLFNITFRNYQYEITGKDFAIILVFFIPALTVFSLDTDHFFNDADNWFSEGMQLLIITLSGAFIILILYLKNYFFLRAKTKRDQEMIERLQRQFAYYKEKERDEKQVRSIYHDLKNHLLLLQGQTQNNDAVSKSINKLQCQIQEYENYHHTGNEFLDIIIREKAKTAKEKQIDFSAAISFESGTFIEPLDISTIFGNALDNAIEASEKLPEESRLITVKADRIHYILVIIVQNNTLHTSSLPQKTTKKNAAAHGFGLPNIQNAVAKYGGQCSIHAEDGIFTLKISIPIPQII